MLVFGYLIGEFSVKCYSYYRIVGISNTIRTFFVDRSIGLRCFSVGSSYECMLFVIGIGVSAEKGIAFGVVFLYLCEFSVFAVLTIVAYFIVFVKI